MQDYTIVMSVVSGITTVLSIVFAILAFGRNKTKDAEEIQTRLARIETDLTYIRQAVDKNDERYEELEKRLRAIEQNKM